MSKTRKSNQDSKVIQFSVSKSGYDISMEIHHRNIYLQDKKYSIYDKYTIEDQKQDEKMVTMYYQEWAC